MLIVVESLLLVAGLIVLAGCAYLALLALLARDPRHSPTANIPGPLEATAHRRGALPPTFFDVLVPAHDEAENIGRTVDNLRRVVYPSDRWRLVVVADNCSDDTANIAKRHGATVWERNVPNARGKGQALAWAFDRSLWDGHADAVVVIDADTVVSRNLLWSFHSRVKRGARAMQAEYGVRNPDDSWRTVLMTLALALFHQVRSLGRERLKLSCGLRGNGMCFTSDLLIQCPHRAFSVVEDLEYGLALGERGVRVHFVPEARVLGDMPPDDQASRVQRARWEAGRIVIARQHSRRLLSGAVRERSAVMLDLAVDLILPPLSTLGAWAFGGFAASVVVSLVAGGTGPHFWLFLAAVVSMSIYLVRGLMLSGLGWRGARVFIWAPVYLVWRLFKVSGRRREAARVWARTPRQRGAG